MVAAFYAQLTKLAGLFLSGSPRHAAVAICTLRLPQQALAPMERNVVGDRGIVWCKAVPAEGRAAPAQLSWASHVLTAGFLLQACIGNSAACPWTALQDTKVEESFHALWASYLLLLPLASILDTCHTPRIVRLTATVLEAVDHRLPVSISAIVASQPLCPLPQLDPKSAPSWAALESRKRGQRLQHQNAGVLFGGKGLKLKDVPVTVDVRSLEALNLVGGQLVLAARRWTRDTRVRILSHLPDLTPAMADDALEAESMRVTIWLEGAVDGLRFRTNGAGEQAAAFVLARVCIELRAQNEPVAFPADFRHLRTALLVPLQVTTPQRH